MFKYGVFSSPYFPVFRLTYFSLFRPNAGKYGPENYLYLDTFHAVILSHLADQNLPIFLQIHSQIDFNIASTDVQEIHSQTDFNIASTDVETMLR